MEFLKETHSTQGNNKRSNTSIDSSSDHTAFIHLMILWSLVPRIRAHEIQFNRFYDAFYVTACINSTLITQSAIALIGIQNLWSKLYSLTDHWLCVINHRWILNIPHSFPFHFYVRTLWAVVQSFSPYLNFLISL